MGGHSLKQHEPCEFDAGCDNKTSAEDRTPPRGRQPYDAMLPFEVTGPFEQPNLAIGQVKTALEFDYGNAIAARPVESEASNEHTLILDGFSIQQSHGDR